jgi:hypothetical protein
MFARKGWLILFVDSGLGFPKKGPDLDTISPDPTTPLCILLLSSNT